VGLLSPAERAYAAGLFDGEGSFNIILRTKQNIFRPVVTFSNNNPLYHAWLGNRFPESGTPEAHRHGVIRKCRSTYWQTIPGLKYLLPSIIPFLTGKREQAELVLALTIGFQGQGKPSKLSRDEQQSLYNEIKRLNNLEYVWDVPEEEVSSGTEKNVSL
jgi:hypothetical protein